MHHYVGELSLRTTADDGRKGALMSGYRGLLRLDSDYFDVMLELESTDRLEPGKSASVKVTLLSPEIACPLMSEGRSYPLCEGTRQVGTLCIASDVWMRIDELARVGKVYEGIVETISWTQATVLFSDGVTSYVSSKDLGLSPWAEAQTAVTIGERIRVRVTAVDKINRVVSVAFAGRALGPGG